MDNKKIITLVTGANRGMGLEIVKELAENGQTVILGSRNKNKGEQAIKDFDDNLAIEVVQLDVTSKESIQNAFNYVENKYGYLSILINNAGAAFDQLKQPSKVTTEIMRKDFDLNFFGLVDVTQTMLPLLKESEYAKIINISSMMGSMGAALMPGSEVFLATAAGYQASKSAVNMFSVQLAKEMKNEKLDISVNMIDPGMVATEFGGTSPEKSIAMGAKPVDFGVARTVKLTTINHQIDTATFSNNYGIVPW